MSCPTLVQEGQAESRQQGRAPPALALKLSLEMEVQIPSGRKGIEHGSPTSWVTALITGLGDKKGMTAAVVNPTSYIFEDFFSLCCKCLKQNILDETKHFPHCKIYGICFNFSKESQKILFQIHLMVGFFSPLSFILLLESIINYLHKPICKC